MKVKTNLRAGSGGGSTTDTSTSTSSKNQTGKGGVTDVVVVYYPPVSRCVGL